MSKISHTTPMNETNSTAFVAKAFVATTAAGRMKEAVARIVVANEARKLANRNRYRNGRDIR